MKTTILGRGFGLYGYLPALLQLSSATVILPITYQKTILSRDDIRHLYSQIEWESDFDRILSSCDGVVMALPPLQQTEWIEKCLKYKNITHYFLEKPLASSPEAGKKILDLLQVSGNKFRIGYNFRYTNWGQSILNRSHSAEKIVWNFRAHHYAKDIQTWKRLHDEGGGALRFYGIHLIALLAEAGYSDVIFSQISGSQSGEAEQWSAELSGANLPNCKISVATHSDTVEFVVQNKTNDIYRDSQPFQLMQSTDRSMDQRIPFLMEGLSDLFTKPGQSYAWYIQANLLWHKIEASLS